MKRQQILVIFVSVMFLGSIISFAFTYAPDTSADRSNRDYNYTEYPPTHGDYINEFPDRNIFEEEVPEPVQVNVLNPYDPSDFPNKPRKRVIGGVWIQYSCKNCSSLVSKLEEITNQYSPRVYLAPYSKMEAKIALTAYYKSKKMDEFNGTAIEDFICDNLRTDMPDRCALRETSS